MGFTGQDRFVLSIETLAGKTFRKKEKSISRISNLNRADPQNSNFHSVNSIRQEEGYSGEVFEHAVPVPSLFA